MNLSTSLIVTVLSGVFGAISWAMVLALKKRGPVIYWILIVSGVLGPSFLVVTDSNSINWDLLTLSMILIGVILTLGLCLMFASTRLNLMGRHLLILAVTAIGTLFAALLF